MLREGFLKFLLLEGIDDFLQVAKARGLLMCSDAVHGAQRFFPNQVNCGNYLKKLSGIKPLSRV